LNDSALNPATLKEVNSYLHYLHKRAKLAQKRILALILNGKLFVPIDEFCDNIVKSELSQILTTKGLRQFL
jgi:hypothetical protein